MPQAQTISFPNLPPRLAGLGELAANLWWSWHPEAKKVFKRLDRRAWKESRHNPVAMLRELPTEVLEEAANDPEFLGPYEVVIDRFRREMEATAGWFREKVARPDSALIAYFSAEYGLHHSLPFYAGGLGFLAGDHIKECSDLGVPMVAVGFMYPEGYLRQRIREDGWQEHLDEYLDRDAASISRVLDEKGNQLVVRVPLIDPPLFVAVWRVPVGRITLYLMDTDIDANSPLYRRTSDHLYAGDLEQRLRQEIVLGIGGSEVLEALSIKRSVLHLNEGHPAFALLEGIRDKVQAGMDYEEAARYVRATSIFTTHTPVPAGHDVFPFDLMEKYFSDYWKSLSLDRDRFMQLGVHPGDPGKGFNMTALALKLTDYHNAVSKRHGEVTRQMWQSLWPGVPVENTPIDHITNGIHVSTWIEPKVAELFSEYMGPHWLDDHDDPLLWELIDRIPDGKLWEIHFKLKQKLVNSIREQARLRWSKEIVCSFYAEASGVWLDPTALTIGFARRFATYKRADLILHDLERLKRLLNDRWRPIQIVFAGKAHPADEPGKKILQRVYQAASDVAMGGRIAFVEDYGEAIAQYLVQGVDVWLNNPLPPMEASGTSGMKAALNGVPNLSILDGWWLECYNGQNGWAFGGQDIVGDRDEADAHAIYDILEKEIVPLYYQRSRDGIPHGWVSVMRQSIKTVAPYFSARRMVKEYSRKFYAPALQSIKTG